MKCRLCALQGGLYSTPNGCKTHISTPSSVTCFVSPIAPQKRCLCTKHLPPLVSAASLQDGEVVCVPSCLTPPPAPHLDSRRLLLHSATADIFSFCSVQQCQQTASTACLWRLVVSLPVHGDGQSTQSAEGTRSACS